MKKLLAIIMSLCLVIGVISVSASAVSESDVLRFDENGEFKILHICQYLIFFLNILTRCPLYFLDPDTTIGRVLEYYHALQIGRLLPFE